MSRRFLASLALFLTLSLAGLILWRAGNASAEQETPAGPPVTESGTNPVADLQHRLENGTATLDYSLEGGYLESLLEYLKVPVSSQTLVFAKNSAQLFFISPETPRAIYFNDDIYVGYVGHGGFIEIAAATPDGGFVFYNLDQQKRDIPFLKHEPNDCNACHDTFTSERHIPRLLMLSVLPDPTGVALKRAALVTNDQSPLRERWGGWFVTGEHGRQRHLGNTVIRTPADNIGEMRDFIKRMDLEAGANVQDLSGRFDFKPYPSRDSDIVALMILGHQTHIHNLIVNAMYNTTAESSGDVVKEYGEPIVRTMLFAEAAPLTEPVKGTSNFTREFQLQGPRDSQGRSLRELDLEKRLLRYPMSYVIYSASFDALPAPVKQYVYTRFGEVLSGKDKSPEFAHLSESDRTAIAEILTATKADFPAVP